MAFSNKGRRYTFSPDQLGSMLAAYQAGASCETIALSLGCVPGTVRRHLLNEGVQLRSTGDHAKAKVVDGTKLCPRCQCWKVLNEFGPGKTSTGKRSYCRLCERQMENERYFQRTHGRYGLSFEAYCTLLAEQGHSCAICREPARLDDRGVAMGFVVDHDHDGGHVRGILCHGCNKILGLARDCPKRLLAAVNYLDPQPLSGTS